MENLSKEKKIVLGFRKIYFGFDAYMSVFQIGCN